MSTRMVRSLKTAVILGIGGAVALLVLFDLSMADGRSAEDKMALFGLVALVHVIAGAATGWALTSGIGDDVRIVRAGAGFAAGFLLPSISWYITSTKQDGSLALLVPVSYVAAPMIGMLFVRPRRALAAGAAVAALIGIIIPILNALDYIEEIGYDGAPFIIVLFFLTYLLPFIGIGAILGFLAEPPPTETTPSPKPEGVA